LVVLISQIPDFKFRFQISNLSSSATLSTLATHLGHPVHLIHNRAIMFHFFPQAPLLVHRLARSSVDNLTCACVESHDRKIFAKLTLDSPTIKVGRIRSRPTFSKEIVAEYQM